MKRIEALALVITKFNGGFTPDDPAMQLNNPGRLRVFSCRTLPTVAEGGMRSFKSWADGFKALVYDLGVKCSGQSRTKLKPDSALKDLLGVWGFKDTRKAVLYLRRSLYDETITNHTPISWFLGD